MEARRMQPARPGHPWVCPHPLEPKLTPLTRPSAQAPTPREAGHGQGPTVLTSIPVPLGPPPPPHQMPTALPQQAPTSREAEHGQDLERGPDGQVADEAVGGQVDEQAVLEEAGRDLGGNGRAGRYVWGGGLARTQPSSRAGGQAGRAWGGRTAVHGQAHARATLGEACTPPPQGARRAAGVQWGAHPPTCTKDM